MTETEKMKKYIERTKLDPNDRFYLDMREAFEPAHQARTCGDLPLEVVSLAFNYGKAKGYRDPNAREGARALYLEYKAWATDGGEFVRRENDFAVAMEAAGFQKVFPKNRKTWQGLRIDYGANYQNACGARA